MYLVALTHRSKGSEASFNDGKLMMVRGENGPNIQQSGRRQKMKAIVCTEYGATYAVVFDAVGKLSAAQGKKALKPGGIYLNVLADSDGGDKLENLLLLKELVEAGQLKPVIDRVYPLEQIVEAHRYVEQGHKHGNVVITLGQNNKT